MKRFAVMAVLVAVGVFFLALGAFAQDAPKLELFGGGSLVRADTAGVSGQTLDSFFGRNTGTYGVTTNYYGWGAEVQGNLNHWLGIVADASGHYGIPVTASSTSGISGLPTLSSYSYLLGPVLSHRTGRFTPFVHALAGMDRLSVGAFPPTHTISISKAETNTALAMALGGGVDLKVHKSISWRLGMDYLYTKHNVNAIVDASTGFPLASTGIAAHENNLRFLTGVVFNFGK